MSFSIGSTLKFVDSLMFLSSSLDELVKNLYSNDDNDKFKDFKNMKNHYNNDELELMCQKGLYPYEWFDNLDKFNCTNLPSIENFYSSLTKKNVTKDEYNHALDVYDKLNCNSFKDYHMHYLKTDILLLSDVFEKFRDTSIKSYKLDPCHYISLPSYSWDSML